MKQIDVNNFVYYLKAESGLKYFIGLQGPLGFRKCIKVGYTILEKAEETKIKSERSSKRKK